MDLQKDLKEFLELFLSKRVDFLVVGAHAVAFHGHPRFTGDIDFLIRTTPGNPERVVEACRAFGFAGPPFTVEEFTRPEQTFQLGRVPNRIDILTSISGIDTEDAWRNRVEGSLSGHRVYFISKEDLIINKLASGRPKDAADVAVLSNR